MTIQGLFFVISLLLGSRSVLQHIFGIRKEDLPPPESHEGEEEEDGPGDADEDDHHGVPDDKPRQIKDIRQDPDDGDETHIWKSTTKITNRFNVDGTKNGRTEKNPKRFRGRTSDIKGGDSRERPAAKNLAEVFVELEPVREYSEYEQKDGESEQHHSRHYAHSVPDFSGGL